MKIWRLSLSCLAAAGLASFGLAAGSQAFAQAAPESVTGGQTSAAAVSPASVEGFRSARFGMDEAGVRDAIQSDFGVAAEAILSGTNPAERTQILSVEGVDVLDGGGAADVSYVFGYQSNELSQVSVLWSADADGAVDGDQLVVNANVLQTFFLNAGYQPESVVTNAPVPEGLLMFRGSDADGRMAVLLLRGTLAAGETAAADAEGESEPRAETVLTPTSLLLAYLANPQDPDVFQIEPGQF